MHPYFKRVWNIRHVLSASSPLLTAKARRMIEENDGLWPKSLAHHEAVRANLHFNDIIVSFSGTANVSGSSVYAQKVYDYAEVNIGYTFANLLTVDKGQVVVDVELLNDVKVQFGGGAEPIRNRVSENRDIIAEAATLMTDGAKAVVDATKTATEGAVGTTMAVATRATGGAKVVVDATKTATEGAVGTRMAASTRATDGERALVDATKTATEGAFGTTMEAYDGAADAVSKSSEAV
jgi:hypothetical protein